MRINADCLYLGNGDKECKFDRFEYEGFGSGEHCFTLWYPVICNESIPLKIKGEQDIVGQFDDHTESLRQWDTAWVGCGLDRTKCCPLLTNLELIRVELVKIEKECHGYVAMVLKAIYKDVK